MKKMAYRCAVLVCALLMLAGVRSAEAAGTVYFTAVNETVLELSDATMPFWHNGYMYVSTAMFADKELGVYSSHNTALQVLVIYSSEKALIFDLVAKKVTDGQGVWQENMLPAVSRQGRLFVPVYMVAEYFGLTYTSTRVELGYVVRLRGEKSRLNDTIFLDAATTLFEYRLAQYEQAKKPVTERPGTQGGETAADGREVCLCFRVTEDVPELLEALAETGAEAAFFFSEEQLTADGALARRILAEGHAIGLVANGDAETAVSEQLRKANGLLWRLTGEKTRLCAVDSGTAENGNEAKDAGYCVLDPDAAADTAVLDAGNAKALYAKIRGVQGAAVVWLSEPVSREGLAALLKELENGGARLSALTETTGLS